ncbi:LOW QUALITY PROTEIN: heat shock 70 kDa protein 12B-like [Diretmus argenteus]
MGPSVHHAVASIGSPVHHAVASMGSPVYPTVASIGSPVQHAVASMGSPVHHAVASMGSPVHHAVASMGPSVHHAVASMGPSVHHAVASMGSPVHHAAASMGPQCITPWPPLVHHAVASMGFPVHHAVASMGPSVHHAVASMGSPVHHAVASMGSPVHHAAASTGPPVHHAVASMGPSVHHAVASMGPSVHHAVASMGPSVHHAVASMGPSVHHAVASMWSPVHHAVASMGSPEEAEEEDDDEGIELLSGPYGAVGVDLAFEAMLCQIFGDDFIQSFKAKRPAAWVDLTIAFEAQRTATPGRANALNISLPFSFIDYYKRHRGQSVETALRRSNMNIVKWSSQGMLRLTQEAMNELFQPTISNIVKHIEELMAKPEVRGVRFLFLVGGFAESPMLQKAVQNALGRMCRIIIPQDVGLTILKGAVLFGLDPTVVRVRRCPLTYGVGVLNRFVEGRHPRDKLLVKDGREWCTDVLDRFVSVDQSVALGEVVRRSYTPARPGQRKIIINIYCSATDDVTYISDPGVRKCGAITLDLPEPLPVPGAVGGAAAGERREIRATMQFGDTEIKVTAVDMMSSRSVRAAIDFLSN